MSTPTPAPTWAQRLRGQGLARPPRQAWPAIGRAALGGGLALAVLAWLTQATGSPWMLGSLGASSLMLFAFPDLPFSQPRHVLAGHVLSSAAGLLCLHLLGPAWWSLGLAMALAFVAMLALRVPHPPAASNPVIVFLGQAGWSFLIMPTLVGAVALLLMAWLYNNLTRPTVYPTYW